MDEDYKVEESTETANLSNSTLNGLLSAPSQEPFTASPKGSFPAELEELINRHSIEGGSNTPDFILAEYLKRCLENFDMCVRRREDWYGRYRPCMRGGPHTYK